MHQINLTHPLAALVDLYSKKEFLLMRGFISSEVAQWLLSTTSDVPVQRVTCGDESISFGQQNFSEEHPIFAFFRSEALKSLARQLTRTDGYLDRLICWTSIYEVSQYINAHTDIAGDLQIIVCLQATAQENGGELCVELLDGIQELLLAPGDAVIFNAAAIRHYTTSVVATNREMPPKRVVAVGRFYFRRA